MRTGDYYTYIITNKYNTTFYVGMTGDIENRISEHKEGATKGFSKKYRLKKLAYLEEFTNPDDAIDREKQLKNWHREWKINLIKQSNPNFKDLTEGDPERDPEINSG